VLAHSSGEWIASDWPVCTLSEMATPRRMGAALTYARRYALFTLVGIAGEDDLDAPDLVGQPGERTPKAGNGFDRGKLNGGAEAGTPGAAGTLGAFAKNRKPWAPPKQALAPEASAALRDRLLGELSSLTADEATAWAQRALGTKNTLRDVDAAIVETAFASRMAELGKDGESPLPSPEEGGEDPAETGEPPGRAELMAALRASAGLGAATEAPLPANRRRRKRRSRDQPPPTLPQPATLAQPGVQPQPEVPPVNNAVVWHVDKSALPLSEPRRYRDRAHLKFVASQPCLRCERQPAEPHHLRFVQPRALGRKVSDEYAVPLCRTHHREVHRQGDEAAWWASAGIDALAVAHRLWQHTRLNEAPIQEHIDPLFGPPTVQAAGPEPPAGPARP
jgi:ERF superfamily